MGIKSEILSELDRLEEAVLKLQGSEKASKKQTDLEIAILKEQTAKTNESRAAAKAKIDGALSILKAME